MFFGDRASQLKEKAYARMRNGSAASPVTWQRDDRDGFAFVMGANARKRNANSDHQWNHGQRSGQAARDTTSFSAEVREPRAVVEIHVIE